MINRTWVISVAQKISYDQLKQKVKGLERSDSDRIRTEAALKTSDQFLTDVFEAIQDGISVLDNDLNVIKANRWMEQMYAFRGPLIGRKCHRVYQELSSPCPWCPVLRSIETGKKHSEIVPYPSAEDPTGWIELTAFPITDKNGNVTGVIEYVKDITERVQAEESLRQSEENYHQLFEAESDAIFLIDNETGNILQANRAACVMYGYRREELLAMKNTDLSDESDQTRKITQETPPVIDQVITIPLRWHRRKDGKRFPVEITGRFFVREGRPVHIAAIRDITDRTKAEEDREKLQNQLIQSQKMESVGRLAGGVAHDFNNMLGVILGHAELAMQQVDPASPVYADIEEIQKAAQHSADLTRQLLAFARRQTAAPRVLNLNDTVTGMLNMLRRLIGEDIDLSWRPGKTLWPIKIDPAQIDQILANLCVNARDAISGVGSITIETENITFGEADCAVHPDVRCGEYVMLAVSDNGCGIDNIHLDRLFEPFFTTKEVGKGTGLGLATVYGIVSQNEGFINVNSEPGKGSTFNLYLPGFVGSAMAGTTETTTQTPASRGETVLLVEDEPLILDVGRAMLERLGYTVLTAGTPGEAIRLARAHADDIHLLMTDVIMPEMNGYDLMKKISDIRSGLKSLFTSGYTADAIAHHGVLDEGLHFLQKPFSMKEMADKVRQALE